MMLHSRARCLTFLSRRLPHALVLTAGLSVAGCGGRFLETPTALSRSLGVSTDEEPAGTATLEDAPESSSTGVRAGARRFLASVFGRDTPSNEPLRDPFLDTPVFAHVETSDATPGLARTADDRAPTADRDTATASVTPSRTIVRPPRRSDASAQPAIDEAAARMAAVAAQMQREQMPSHDLPEWARGATQSAAAPQLAQQDDASPWSNQQTSAAAAAGRVRIGRLQSQHPGAESAPAPSRQIESLLAARQQHPEPGTTSNTSPAIARHSTLPEQPTAPDSERPATDFAQRYAAVIAQRESELPSWATAAAQPRAQQARQAPPKPNRDVRDLPTHFQNVQAVAELPAPTSVPQFTRNVATASAATGPETWQPSSPAVATDDSTSDSPFPVLNEWRSVDANLPMSIADRDGREAQAEFDVHQTAFEEQVAAVVETGFEVVNTPKAAVIAPVPPADANPGIQVFRATSSEPEQSGSILPWFVALLAAVGLGAFFYRRHLQRQDSHAR